MRIEGVEEGERGAVEGDRGEGVDVEGEGGVVGEE